MTEEIRKRGKRVGFKLENLETGEEGLLSHVNKCSGPRVGKYHVCIDQLDLFAPRAIESDIDDKELLVIDEIGPMELKSVKFLKSVEKSMEKDVDLLFTIHRKSDHPLLRKIRKEFKLLEITTDNRNDIYNEIASVFNLIC